MAIGMIHEAPYGALLFCPGLTRFNRRYDQSMNVRQQLDLDLLKLPLAVRSSVGAEVARALADGIDGQPGDRDLASLSKELRATMAELTMAARATPVEDDPIDAAENRGPSPIPIGSARSARQLG